MVRIKIAIFVFFLLGVPTIAGAVQNALSDAQFVSFSNVPTTMVAGDTTTVSVTFKNDYWENNENTYDLAQWKSGFNSLRPTGHDWGIFQVKTTTIVDPLKTYTFTFDITAPATPGNYSFGWRMFRTDYVPTGFFGQPSITQTISVSAESSGDGEGEDKKGGYIPADPAACPLGAGTPAGFDARYLVKFKPTTDQYMASDENSHYSAPPKSLNIASGEYRVTLVSWDDHSGQKSCYQSGDCEQDEWQQAKERFFVKLRKSGGGVLATSASTADLTDNQNIRTDVVDQKLVIPTGVANVLPYHSAAPDNGNANTVYGICVAFDKIKAAPNSAACDSISAPDSVTVGQVFAVSAKMANVGSDTWVNSGAKPYKLSSELAADNMTWGLNRVDMPIASVAPGANVTFDFNATAPSSAGTYNLAFGMVQESVGHFPVICQKNVTVTNDSNIILDLSANPTNVMTGATTTLTWESTGASSCTASAGSTGWPGERTPDGSWVSGPMSADATYTITCSGSSGTLSKSVTVTVGNFDPPTLNFSADPSNVSFGDTTTLTWDSTGADSCTGSVGSPGWPDTRPVDGSWISGSLGSSVTYTMTCIGPGGTVSKSVDVTVGSMSLNVVLDSDPSSVPFDGITTLSWSSTGAVRCEATGGPWSGDKELSGSEETAKLKTTTTYEITCWDNAGNSDVDSVTVVVSSATLSVDLKANLGSGYVDQGSGVWPLENVDLKATLSGTATGDILYKFWCDARDTNPTITETISTTDKPHIMEHFNLCDYESQGRYFAKVEALRSGITARDTVEIVVANSCSLSFFPGGSYLTVKFAPHEGYLGFNQIIEDILLALSH